MYLLQFFAEFLDHTKSHIIILLFIRSLSCIYVYRVLYASLQRRRRVMLAKMLYIIQKKNQ